MKKQLLLTGSIFFSFFAFAQNARILNSAQSLLSDQEQYSPAKYAAMQLSATACDTLNYPINPLWSSVYYTTGTNGVDGFVNGPNIYNDKEKAMYFHASTSPYTK